MPADLAAVYPLCWFLVSSPMLGPSRRRADAVCGGQSRRRPHRLVAQDTALSRRRHGFESRWGHARFRRPPGPWPRCAEGPSAARRVRHDAARNPGSSEVRVVRGGRPDHLYRTGRQTRLGHAGLPRRLGSASRATKPSGWPLFGPARSSAARSRSLASLAARRWYALPVEGGCLLQSPSRGYVGYGWRYEVL